MKGSWVTEVWVGSEWVGNGVRWPDRVSAEQAGYDLLCRWFVPTDYRAVQSTDPPNRATWDEHTTVNGLPPRSVTL